MPRRLVVFVPGLDVPLKRCRALLDALQADPELSPPRAEWLLFGRFIFRIGLRRLASYADELTALINQKWIARGGFDEIVLVGHSAGGLLVRQAYLMAAGAGGAERYQWASAVTRIVLLAAPNRGVSKLSLVNALGDRAARLFLFFLRFTYQDVMEGSTFVTNLRLEWIRYFRSRPPDANVPVVVQLRGTADDVVKQNDSHDVLAFQNSVMIPLAAADHRTIAVLPTRGNGELTDEAREWVEVIERAILGTPESLGLVNGPQPAPAVAQKAKRVVFVVHGIRARDIDEWLDEVEREIERQDPEAKVIRPSYNYFTARQFALPSVRRRNIRHLQDQYAEQLAENPDAEFHFIGHSNGTYMFGRSLADIPAMRFGRVVLAGSVLPTDFFRPGSTVLRQVAAVRSDCGQLDWPVGILCRVLNKTLFMKDVGTAGYDGFIGTFVTQVRYHPGGHGDMFNESNVRSMVRFVIEGATEAPPLDTLKENARFRTWSLAAPYIAGFVLALLLFFPLIFGVPSLRLWYSIIAGLAFIIVVGLDIA